MCVYCPPPSVHPLSPPSLAFPFSGFSLLSDFLIPDLSFHCVSDASSLFLSSLPLILPSFARHRGCNSAQQLLSWHVLHCLLTVLFLLDFIKTPSAISSGMVEEVLEEEKMREEGDGRKQ